MIVTPKTKDHPELVILKNGNDLESMHFEDYINNIQFNLDKESYIHYWRMIQSKLKGIERVYLSKDGIYHSISLGGLLNPETGKYLAEEMDIQIVGSTRDLVTPRHNRSPNQEIKLVGFPAYNSETADNLIQDENNFQSLTRVISGDSTGRFFGGRDIPLLPGTEIEVSKLSELMKQAGLQVSLYVSEQATEAAIKSWKNPMIVHIATHGYFLKDNEIVHDNVRIGGISSDVLIDNPLLRSGLLLAHAKQALQSGGDGILTAYEAKSLNLDETELVVLSACETGLGEVNNGEGVYGLQRAFQAAGAANVLMSLWKVDDNATQLLMRKFYEFWLEGNTKRSAFRMAQDYLRTETVYKAPYYWGSFVFIGMGMPKGGIYPNSVKSKNNWNYLWLLLLVPAGLMVFLIRKRIF